MNVNALICLSVLFFLFFFGPILYTFSYDLMRPNLCLSKFSEYYKFSYVVTLQSAYEAIQLNCKTTY